MFRENIKKMLRTLGFQEELDDKTIRFIENQFLDLLEHPMPGQSASIPMKTGCLIHNLVLFNYEEVKEHLKEEIQKGNPPRLPKLQFGFSTMCLHLTPERRCSVLDEDCPFAEKNSYHECEIVKESLVDPELEKWK